MATNTKKLRVKKPKAKDPEEPVTIRFPAEIRRLAVLASEADYLSFNSFVVRAVAAAIAKGPR